MATHWKLIEGWKQSWKLASMWVAIAITIISVLDVILRQFGEQVPYWIFYFTGPGVAIARILKQYIDEEACHGDDED